MNVVSSVDVWNLLCEAAGKCLWRLGRGQLCIS